MGRSVGRDDLSGDPPERWAVEFAEAPGWLAIQTLLDANARTGAALEHHLRRIYYETAEPDYEAVEASLTRAIIEHQRIIGDLELAREALDRLEREE